MELVNENGEVATWAKGEIIVFTQAAAGGPVRRYYNDLEKTKAAWHYGAYHTGDVAWKDEEGYYWFVGRADDVIKSSGYRIGPFEVESALMEHDAVVSAPFCRARSGARSDRQGDHRGSIGYEPSEALIRIAGRQTRDGAVQVPAPDRVCQGVAQDPFG